MVLSGDRMTKKSILGAAPGSGSKSASMIRECKSCKSEDSEWDPNQHVAIWTTLRAVWIALFEAHLKATFTNHFKPMSSPNPGQIFQTHCKTTGLGINPEDPEVGAPDTQRCSLSARRCCSSSRSRWISWVYHYIRARGLGGDGPKDIISSVSAEFVVALRHNRVSKPKTEKLSLAEWPLLWQTGVQLSM